MADPGREMVAVAVGGVGGSVLVAALRRAGIGTGRAAVGVVAGAGVGSLMLGGVARRVVVGAAAAGPGCWR